MEEFVDHRKHHGAAPTTVEALMYSLRRGAKTLEDPAARRRLSEVNDDQLLEIATRVQRFKPHIAPAWTDAEVAFLIELHEAAVRA